MAYRKDSGLRAKFIGGTKHKASLTLGKVYDVISEHKGTHDYYIRVHCDRGTARCYNRKRFKIMTAFEVGLENFYRQNHDPSFMQELRAL